MNCNRCDATYTIVTFTNPIEGDRVKRTRKCPECGCVFNTIEVLLEAFERLEYRSANYQTLVSAESRSKAKGIADKMLREGRQGR